MESDKCERCGCMLIETDEELICQECFDELNPDYGFNWDDCDDETAD